MFEFGVLLFDYFVHRQNVTCPKCFTRYGHYAGVTVAWRRHVIGRCRPGGWTETWLEHEEDGGQNCVVAENNLLPL